MTNPIHHLELWTAELDSSSSAFEWLLTGLGWRPEHDPAWPQGRTWQHPTGVYVVLEASPAVAGEHDRLRAGLNHLALRAVDLAQLDALRQECTRHGWTELFADRYPHAGGPQHTALFLENAEGFEVEIVAE